MDGAATSIETLPFYLCPKMRNGIRAGGTLSRERGLERGVRTLWKRLPGPSQRARDLSGNGVARSLTTQAAGVCLNCDARHPRIERLRIRGFRSLADVDFSPPARCERADRRQRLRQIELREVLQHAELDAEGSKDSQEFVGREGGADDQLHGGNETTSRLDAEVSIRTHTGRNDYRFTLAYAHPDELLFTEEAFRYSRDDIDDSAPWHSPGQRAPGGAHRRGRASGWQLRKRRGCRHRRRARSPISCGIARHISSTIRALHRASKRVGTRRITHACEPTAATCRPSCTGWNVTTCAVTRLNLPSHPACTARVRPLPA